MSIAAISSSFVAAMRLGAATAPAEPVESVAAPERAERGGGRRHQLVDAMNQALGQSGPQSKEAEQAVFRFAHALMHDLRSIETDLPRPGPGRGAAWGRRDWSDLPQRIDALATAAASPGAGSASTVAPSNTGAAPAEAAPVPAPLPEPPLQPNPVTTTSAAVHLMQVPTSRLVEAYMALQQALGVQQPPAVPAGDARSALAAFLTRLSNTLEPDAAAALPAGSVLHVTA